MADVLPPESLSELLKSNKSNLRELAIIAMGKKGTPAMIKPLTNVLQNNDFSDRTKAAEALGKIADQGVVEPLMAALQDSFYRVKVAAAKALGERKETRAAPALMELVKTPDKKPKTSSRYSRRRNTSFSSKVRTAAFEALENMADLLPVQTLIELHKHVGYRSKSKVKKLLIKTKDPGAVDAFIAELKSKNSSTRRTMVEILGQRKERRAVGPLIEMLKSRDRWERKRAANALKSITGKDFGVKYKKWKKWWKKWQKKNK